MKKSTQNKLIFGIILSAFLRLLTTDVATGSINEKIRSNGAQNRAITHTCLCAMADSEESDQTFPQLNFGGTLPEITRPYLGVYECKSLYFGGEDKKDIFDYFRLELKSDGELCITYKTKKGEANKIPLRYEYDFKEKLLRVTGAWGILKIDKEFPLKNSELTATLTLFGKLVNVKFSRA